MNQSIRNTSLISRLALLPAMIVAVVAAMNAAPAHAQDKSARAIQNSTRLTAFLDAVPPEHIMTVVEKISSGDIQRFAPEQPVWIIDSSSGTLLYYQGQPGFNGQSASLLVDDAGVRFGQKALDNAKNSRSGWVRMQLGNAGYSAYCHSKYPTIVCSLIP